MNVRRVGLSVLFVLLGASVLLGALVRLRPAEVPDLVRQAATAHLGVSFRATAARIGAEGKGPFLVRHDAGTGRTEYGWRNHSFVLARPAGRLPDPSAWC
ncbi:MAG: hypothetical protein ACE5JG_05315, partial [Planctomycetota bacterium]